MKKNIIILLAFVLLSFVTFAQQPSLFNFTPTSQSATFYGQAQIDGVVASADDWIAAFDTSGNCAGASQIIINSGIAYINLVIYGDDPTSSLIDEGISGSEEFSLKLYDHSSGNYLDYPSNNNINLFSGWTNTNGAPLIQYNNVSTIYNFISSISLSLSLNINVCENDQAINLSGGIPAGGTYSINGTATTIFDPLVLGPGQHVIEYNFNGNNVYDTAVVRAKSDASLITKGPYCDNDSMINLLSVTSGGTYAGNGVISNNFFPSMVGVGSFWISYSLTDSNQCSQIINDLIIVNKSPQKPDIVQNGNSLESSIIGTDYIWYNSNLSPIQNSNSMSFVPINNGVYYVEVFNNDCSMISNPFNFSSVSSTNEIGNIIQLDQNEIILNWTKFSGVEIYDINSKLCYKSKNKKINFNQLNNGLYIVVVRGERENHIFKFIK